MRARPALLLAATTAGLVVGLLACFDLFHSTGDVLTACQLDAQTPGCGDGGVDFCSWTPPEARQNAQRACAWLGACETPMGRNAFGPCMFQALLAYDCAANPDHRVEGTAHDLWACLSKVQTCADVDTCVFPHGVQVCKTAGDYLQCGTGADPTSNNYDVRLECDDGDGSPAHAENCALFGQTCVSTTVGGVCAGTREAGVCASTPGCDGTALHYCDDAGNDIGIDCADNGAARCNAFPQPKPSWVACVPQGDEGSCAPSENVQCAQGIATTCPTGVPETIDCASLLQSPAACSDAGLSPSFDWTSPCVLPEAGAGPGCTADSCSGYEITGCARNAAFTVDCATVGLGLCAYVATDQDAGHHAACGKP